ncbi:hypothetical protein OG992_11885 [Micromonospora sp. NBC_00362]|uniref:hypothetical protein n=1 Tax=Micromonospora sp. NBC_00362 TaxID=2975975 RepID=UPI00224C8517|nr:hypothetical protein [Micromonospora sp. NBC_00362]MCX5117884.1 hypothetical protein [Micromonospora sp. NBC_00362]
MLVLAGLAGCVEQPAPPTPSVSATRSALPNEPQALMATIGGLVKQTGVGDDIRQGEIETGEAWYEPCDLLIADPDRAKNTGLQLDAVWSAGLEVNPVPSFQNIQPPMTLLNVRVFHLPDASAAVAGATRARAARCPSEEFRLNIGQATARWGSGAVTIASTSARLTTATVERVDPAIDAGVDYLPGDARLVFAHGPLLISIEALALWPRQQNSAAEITAAAQEKAMSLAAAVVKTLSTSSEN